MLIRTKIVRPFELGEVLADHRAEMAALGWLGAHHQSSLGDAYVDHPIFRHGHHRRVLEAAVVQGGHIAQTGLAQHARFRGLGMPRLFFGVTGGTMDSMVNRYKHTSDRAGAQRRRHTPGGQGASARIAASRLLLLATHPRKPTNHPSCSAASNPALPLSRISTIGRSSAGSVRVGGLEG